MTCYYPLLGLPHGIDASVTFSTFSHNERTAAVRPPRSHSLDVALYRAERGRWRCLDRLPVPEPGDLTLTSAGLDLAPGELVVLVPLERDRREDPGDGLLPLPCSKRVDRSPVAERASLGFRWRGVTSSYQGEYPVRMAQIDQGTMLSFDALFQSGPTVGRNLLCLVNLCRQPEEVEHRLELFDAHAHRLMRTATYRRNSCCLVDVPPEEAATKEVFVRSTTSLGIPILLTLSREDLPPSMSVEHTHPPTEFFSERDRLSGSRAIKRTWLGMALS
ncbi:MAG: hypothetical protein VKI81_09485 [Synechococcaceae cyanobacterium]|nr:hypothetical protein [Synechococcaceae cyanobacterium]